MRKLFIAVAFIAGMSLQTGIAHAFVVDGNLSDWGVTPGAWSGPLNARVNSSDWVPNAGIRSTVEDYDPIGNGQVGPGWGGQNFDAEAMYAAYDSTNLYFAIVTGKNPGIESNERPGDIAFDFGSNGSYEYGIETVTRGNFTAGNLYAVNTWKTDPYWGTHTPTEMNTVNRLLGVGSFIYTSTSYPGSHYVIEGSIAKSYFGSDWVSGTPFTMSWTQTCANDVINLQVTPSPEPMTMTLFGIGLAGLGLIRRKQYNS
ncbi:MAG: PEP-CTERM sorting domain-containing protein [Candidatus Omnitrophica bacterium]|nr:PEP-CTERM sorting domain-containing protein [Candidatus Omnitrophota bacterium]